MFLEERYCYKQNQTVPSFIRFRPTNSLKTKMAVLSFLINHYHQTRYIRLSVQDDYICKGLLQAIYLFRIDI